ncbi:acylamino-acid-releasing enzyme [Penicillium maclennaniae]|uniref:acylamino-acid-releasing enzyme n=1 Tax=Penicillium maclennaniae TaxID=1343394 RepID=UPI00254018A6|nr:acylamino-acid-releasing enzyme [Penicillium maclennaniae]KAJ5668489.1 acylamino-acid-releasing enzyme [Penicillium maclennaniae]
MVVDLTWAANGNIYFCGGIPADKIFAGFGAYRIDPTTKPHLYNRKEELEVFDAIIDIDNKFVLAVATSDVNHPVEVFTTFSSDGAITRMSNHGQEFAGRRFGTCKFLTCTLTDGEVELDTLYLIPASSSVGDHRRPLATAVLIQGGPNTRLTNAFNTYYYMLTL